MLMDNDDVEKINISQAIPVSTNSYSKGNQRKWMLGNIFIKLDLLGYESTAEVLVSRLLKYTNIDSYVQYEPCDIFDNDKYLGSGCYSYDFRGGYNEVTAATLLESDFLPMSISYDDFLDYLYDFNKTSHKRYIDQILCLDAITRNDDRHFNNISFLDKDGVLTAAPIFDNGGACMSDLNEYPMSNAFAVNYISIKAKPFRLNFIEQLFSPEPIIIDVNRFKNSVDVSNRYSKRAYRTILRGLEETEGAAWVRKF